MTPEGLAAWRVRVVAHFLFEVGALLEVDDVLSNIFPKLLAELCASQPFLNSSADGPGCVGKIHEHAAFLPLLVGVAPRFVKVVHFALGAL